MSLFDVTLEGIPELEAEWKGATRSLSWGMAKGVREGIEEGIEVARREHKYKDRSGFLTASLVSKMITTSFLYAEGEMEAYATYASFVENGRGPVHVINAKALRWEDENGVHFAKSVGPAAPRPFMGPGLQKAERVIEREIQRVVNQVAEMMNR